MLRNADKTDFVGTNPFYPRSFSELVLPKIRVYPYPKYKFTPKNNVCYWFNFTKNYSIMNIAIVENNNFYRESLKTALNQIVDFDVVFDSDNLNSLFQNFEILDFQIILLDLIFYQPENISKILKSMPEIKILILSNFSEKCFFENSLFDFIPKCSNKNLFEQKIRKLLKINIVTI